MQLYYYFFLLWEKAERKNCPISTKTVLVVHKDLVYLNIQSWFTTKVRLRILSHDIPIQTS